MHPSITLFIEPPDVTNPRFIQLQSEMEVMNLISIEADFKTGKYQSTFKLASDMRKMWVFYLRYFQNDPEKIEKTKEIQQYFDRIFTNFDLENKQLVAPPPPSQIAGQTVGSNMIG
jgi:hypothetical protein